MVPRIDSSAGPGPRKAQGNRRPGPGAPRPGTFRDHLDRARRKPGELTLSAHAEHRIRDRGIAMDARRIARLNGAVAKAREKGARESLILDASDAFIVSVRNNTVITAIDGPNVRENVFTNIDSAVVT